MEHGRPLDITVDGRTVAVSKPEKPLFPDGTSKADLARYYAAVAEAMVPLVRDRPLNLERYPDGIDAQKVYQQHAGKHFPDWIPRVEVRKEGGTVLHAVVREGAALVYLAQQGCITPHAWTSRADRLERPDRLIIDLDPSEGSDLDVRTAALTVGETLRELGLEPFAMTTGSKGFHLVVPLQRRADHEAVREVASGIAALIAAREPERFTTEFRKAKRDGRILLDVMRNRWAHTAVAPYAVRARPGAPVATPLRWEELEDPATQPASFTLRDVPERLRAHGCPWAQIADAAAALGGVRRRLARLAA
jgi:bifunctional non-homologous end joining protein LigD